MMKFPYAIQRFRFTNYKIVLLRRPHGSDSYDDFANELVMGHRSVEEDRYRAKLKTEFGVLPRLRGFSVVAVGFERLVFAPSDVLSIGTL